MKQYKSQSGQIVIVFLLIMLVALTVGLTITQKSLTSVVTSTQTEQATRAFSAAEAGIAKAIQQSDASIPLPTGSIDLGNQSSTRVSAKSVPAGTEALEYPPIDKSLVAQFWLANPETGDPNVFFIPAYTHTDFELYFGDPVVVNRDIAKDPASKPAVEITVVTENGPGNYLSFKKFIDSDSVRTDSNSFVTPGSLGGGCSTYAIITTASPPDSAFYCKALISGYTGTPVMARVRLLYSRSKQKVAIRPTRGSLPPQAVIFNSTGLSGESQKTIQVFRLKYVVPLYFDFAIFSAGDIQK